MLVGIISLGQHDVRMGMGLWFYDFYLAFAVAGDFGPLSWVCLG